MRGLRFSRRADGVLAVVDVFVSALACWLAYVLRFEGQLPLPSQYAARYVGMSAGTSVAVVVAGRAAGLYRRAALRPGTSNVEPAVDVGVLVGVALLLVDQAGLSGQVSRAWIGLVTLFLILSGIVTRSFLAHGRRALVPLGVALERYAVVGSGLDARRLINDMTRASGAPFRIVGALSPDLPTHELVAQATDLRVEGLVFPATAESQRVATLAAELAGHGMDVLLAPRLGELDLRIASVVTLQGVPLLRLAGAAPRRKAVRQDRERGLKRGVAILGTRGIPANYGGFETFAERLALRLVDAGIPVTVYCRRHYATAGSTWRGVTLKTLPTIRHKYLDTVVHTVLSVVHLLVTTRIRDVIVCNAANAPVLPLLRIGRTRVVMNVDGLEWRRGKWGIVGRAWYRLGEWLSVRFASVLVTDAEEVRTYYRVRHDTDSIMVPYGADLTARGQPMPPEVSLAPDGFALYVSRWETENNPLLVASAHAESRAALGLVMLGGATYDDALEREVRAAAAPNAILPGALFGMAYTALQSNARCYVHATEVGGTHPALIEAMGAGNLCLVLDTPENREVAGTDAWYFGDTHDLAVLLRRAAELPQEVLSGLRDSSRSRAAELFSWGVVGDTYLDLLRGRSRPRQEQPMPRA